MRSGRAAFGKLLLSGSGSAVPGRRQHDGGLVSKHSHDKRMAAITGCIMANTEQTDDATSGEKPIWVHGRKLMEALDRAPAEASWLAMSLLTVFGMQEGGTFRFDAVTLATALNKALPRPAGTRGITAKQLKRCKPYLAKVFSELPDGRWALNPDLFSVTDPYLEDKGERGH